MNLVINGLFQAGRGKTFLQLVATALQATTAAAGRSGPEPAVSFQATLCRSRMISQCQQKRLRIYHRHELFQLSLADASNAYR